MAKGQDAKKSVKKKSEKTLKEKRKDKKAKKHKSYIAPLLRHSELDLESSQVEMQRLSFFSTFFANLLSYSP